MFAAGHLDCTALREDHNDSEGAGGRALNELISGTVNHEQSQSSPTKRSDVAEMKGVKAAITHEGLMKYQTHAVANLN